MRRTRTISFKLPPEIITFDGVPDARKYKPGRDISKLKPFVLTNRYVRNAARHEEIARIVADHFAREAMQYQPDVCAASIRWIVDSGAMIVMSVRTWQLMHGTCAVGM